MPQKANAASADPARSARPTKKNLTATARGACPPRRQTAKRDVPWLSRTTPEDPTNS